MSSRAVEDLTLFLHSPNSHHHLLSLPATTQEGEGGGGLKWLAQPPSHRPGGGGLKWLAQPPHERWSLFHGGWEVEQACFLVGNN